MIVIVSQLAISFVRIRKTSQVIVHLFQSRPILFEIFILGFVGYSGERWYAHHHQNHVADNHNLFYICCKVVEIKTKLIKRLLFIKVI